METATISAELFYGLAQHIDGRRMIDDPLWRPVAEKASTLLDHDDPFGARHCSVGVGCCSRRESGRHSQLPCARLVGEMLRAETGVVFRM